LAVTQYILLLCSQLRQGVLFKGVHYMCLIVSFVKMTLGECSKEIFSKTTRYVEKPGNC